jgi:hypothetical protein
MAINPSRRILIGVARAESVPAVPFALGGTVAVL